MHFVRTSIKHLALLIYLKYGIKEKSTKSNSREYSTLENYLLKNEFLERRPPRHEPMAIVAPDASLPRSEKANSSRPVVLFLWFIVATARKEGLKIGGGVYTIFTPLT